MDREQLQEALRGARISESAYSLFAENFDPNEALCLRQEGESWLIYYSERGLQTGKRVFGSESEACSFFLEQLRDDPTAKIGWDSGCQMSAGA